MHIAKLRSANLLLLDVASLIVGLYEARGQRAAWRHWAVMYPFLCCIVSHQWAPHDGSSDFMSTSSFVWLLTNSLLCLPLPNRAESAAGHALLHASRLSLFHADAIVSLIAHCSAMLLGELLGQAILAREGAAVATSTDTALESGSKTIEALKGERTCLTPTISWDDIEVLHQIGIGAFGSVHAVWYAGTLTAAKVMHKGKANAQALLAEQALMLTLRHPHVLTCIGLVSDGNGRHAILMEMMCHSLTHLLLDRHQDLAWSSPLLRISLQVRLGTTPPRSPEPTNCSGRRPHHKPPQQKGTCLAHTYTTAHTDLRR